MTAAPAAAAAKKGRNIEEAAAQAETKEPGPQQLKFKMLRAESEMRHETKDVPNQERKQYRNALWNMMRMDMGPRHTVSDMVGANEDQLLDVNHESTILRQVDYYHKKSDHGDLIKVLKFYACYMLQQARKEPIQSKQLFLVFKAFDLLRMVAHYSNYSTNVDSESVIYQLFIDMAEQLPGRFDNYVENEKKIFALAKNLGVNPGEHKHRLFMAQFLTKQTSFIDAISQYHTLLKMYPKVDTSIDTNRGMVFVRIGDIFENLLKKADEKLQDARKLKNFIDRYNRDFATSGLAIKPIAGPHRKQILETRASLLKIAYFWYEQALQVKKLSKPLLSKLSVKTSEQLISQGRYKEALNRLMSANEGWVINQRDIKSLTERVDYLKMVTEAAIKSKNKATANWARDELAVLDPLLNNLVRTKNEEKRKSSSVIDNAADDEESEEEDNSPKARALRKKMAKRNRKEIVE